MDLGTHGGLSMKSLALISALTFVALCDPTAPCRCEERTLGEYFAGADEVAVGRLLEIIPASGSRIDETGADLLMLRFELTGAPYKTPDPSPLSTGDVVEYRTAASTAECGIQGQLQGVYVLFATSSTTASGDAAVGTIDSCSGTRAMLTPGSSEPRGFVDVPARFVAQQLNSLAGLEVLGRVVENAPKEGATDGTVLIGLLDVAAFSHVGHATVRAERRLEASVVGEVDSYDGLESLEAGYEEPAAVVFGRVDGWYRLRLSDGTEGWLSPDQAGTFQPYPDLAINRLNYIRAPWHGFVWPSAGAGSPARTTVESGQREVPIEVLERMDVGGFPWLRVNVMRDSPCEVAEPAVRVSGWIPAWGPEGTPTVWFYSRGC